MRVWAQLLSVAVLGVGGTVAVAHLVPSSRSALETAGVIGLLERVGLAPAPAGIATLDAPRGTGGMGGGAAEVTGAPPRRVAETNEVAAIGTGTSRRSVAVRAEVSGRLAEVLVVSGQRVEAGQVLARLEAASETIALTRAELVLQDAQSAYDRLTRLQSAGTASELQRSTAELALRQAELAVDQARFELSRRTVLAPIGGLAGIIELGSGDQVTASDAITVIDDRSEIVVDFTVPERFVGRIAVGGPVTATPLARPDLRLEGEIRAIDNRVDPASRTIRVQSAIDNDEDILRAGMAFSMRLSFGGDTHPAVDPLAIQWSSEGAFVWVVRDERALQVPVQIVQRSASEVLVRAEFEPGDIVVSEGVQALRAGAPAVVRGATDAGAQAGGLPQQG